MQPSLITNDVSHVMSEKGNAIGTQTVERSLMRRKFMCIAVLAVSWLAVGPTAGPATADVFHPTRVDDPMPDGCQPADCSLREAVIEANGSRGRDTVVMRSSATYRLELPGDPGAGECCDQESTAGDLDVDDRTVLRTSARSRATVSATALIDPEEDGVIDLTDRTSRIQNLVVRDGGVGIELGSLRRGEGVKIVNSVIRNNFVGILGRDPVKLRTSRVVANDSGIEGRSNTRISRSRIVRNRTFGVAACGPVRISATSVRDNGQVGIRAGEGGPSSISCRAQLTLRNSTVADNGNRSEVAAGGVRVQNGKALIVNATVAANRSADVGGGVGLLAGRVEMRSSTVARNRAAEGGGLWLGGNVTRFELANSLIALNAADTRAERNCAGRFVSAGHNLVSPPAGRCRGIGRRSDLLRAKPRIGTLADNGGRTDTIKLLRRSPAVNAANPRTSPPRDQRGARRDRRPDIGAYERH